MDTTPHLRPSGQQFQPYVKSQSLCKRLEPLRHHGWRHYPSSNHRRQPRIAVRNECPPRWVRHKQRYFLESQRQSSRILPHGPEHGDGLPLGRHQPPSGPARAWEIPDGRNDKPQSHRWHFQPRHRKNNILASRRSYRPLFYQHSLESGRKDALCYWIAPHAGQSRTGSLWRRYRTT